MTHMLESAGSGLDRIVKMTVVLANSRDFDEMHRVWRTVRHWLQMRFHTASVDLSRWCGVVGSR
jgi:enamine deaminase RidA (YjgF/YER057c/UK114 family)